MRGLKTIHYTCPAPSRDRLILGRISVICRRTLRSRKLCGAGNKGKGGRLAGQSRLRHLRRCPTHDVKGSGFRVQGSGLRSNAFLAIRQHVSRMERRCKKEKGGRGKRGRRRLAAPQPSAAQPEEKRGRRSESCNARTRETALPISSLFFSILRFPPFPFSLITPPFHSRRCAATSKGGAARGRRACLRACRPPGPGSRPRIGSEHRWSTAADPRTSPDR